MTLNVEMRKLELGFAAAEVVNQRGKMTEVWGYCPINRSRGRIGLMHVVKSYVLAWHDSSAFRDRLLFNCRRARIRRTSRFCHSAMRDTLEQVLR